MSNLEDYLKKIGGQKESVENLSKLIVNPKIDDICKKYKVWIKKTVNFSLYQDDLYLMVALDNFKVTAKDIRDFSVILKKYEALEGFVWSGIFLSYLINNSSEDNFEILIEHITIDIDFLGCKNIKNVDIKGNAGVWVGDSMQRGKISISGNTQDGVGHKLYGGTITVEGNSGDYIGDLMTGGKVIVKRNAGFCAGPDSKGGEIHVCGELKSIDETCKAKIYHKSKLIWPIK